MIRIACEVAKHRREQTGRGGSKEKLGVWLKEEEDEGLKTKKEDIKRAKNHSSPLLSNSHLGSGTNISS